MAHQFSSEKSDDQIPLQVPLELKKPHQPKDKNKKQKEEGEGEIERLTESSSNGASNNNKIDDSGRERLKRHRVEVAGRVWIPEIWGQEELLKDWIDSTAFDAPLLPTKILTARTALVQAAAPAATRPTTLLVD